MAENESHDVARFERGDKVPMYVVTWSAGSSAHDERRNQRRVSPTSLARFIESTQALGHVIFSVEKVSA